MPAEPRLQAGCWCHAGGRPRPADSHQLPTTAPTRCGRVVVVVVLLLLLLLLLLLPLLLLLLVMVVVVVVVVGW